jgi:hypothetical protein
MGHRDAGDGRSRHRRRDARDDLDRNPRGHQRRNLFAAAPEDVGIAALETDDMLACESPRDQQRFDLMLLECGKPPRLAGEDPLRSRRGLRDQHGIDQAVVNQNVGGANPRQSPHCDQLGISRTRADDRDPAQDVHRAPSASAATAPAPAATRS